MMEHGIIFSKIYKETIVEHTFQILCSFMKIQENLIICKEKSDKIKFRDKK